jgi:peptide/nickel transport system substrate-binding protein
MRSDAYNRQGSYRTLEVKFTMARRMLSLILVASFILAARIPAARAQDAITIGVTDLPSTLDPAEAYDFNAWEVLSHLYVGLTRQVPGTLDYELALAADYRVSDDRLTYAFTLRPDAAFSDGTPITAQTFVDSIQRVLALKHDAIQAVEPYVASVEASNQGELIFHLVQPVPFFLELIALPPYFPQHPTLAAQDRAQPFAEQGVIGNGPYLLERFDVRQQIVLQANPAYNLGPQPATATIILKNFARSQDLRDALRDHQIDLAWRTLLLDHLLELQEESRLQVVETPSTRVFYLYMGQSREPTDDPLVRQAITLMIDRQAAVDRVFHSHLTALTSLIPAQLADAYDPAWPDTPDITAAEEVLSTAGYKDRTGRRLEFTVQFPQPVYGDPYTSAVTQLVRSSFTPSKFVDTGLFTEIERNTAASILTEGDANVAVFAWTPLVPHPYAYLYPLFDSSQAMPTNSRYARPDLDTLLDQAALLDDPASAGPIYRLLAQQILDDYAMVPLWQDHIEVVAWDDIDGILVEPNYFLHYDQLVRR